MGSIISGSGSKRVIPGLLASGDALLALLVPSLIVVHASGSEERADDGVDLLDDLNKMVVCFVG